MPVWLSAGLWGLLGASSLVVGAAGAYLVRMPRWATASIMSFGCGILISAVAYDLLEDGFEEGGLLPIIAGALTGSATYAIADWIVSARGGHHRKRSGAQQQSASDGSGLAIAIGSLLDGIPESIVLGLTVISGKGLSIAMFAAIFLSNFPEGLSSGMGMRRAGRNPVYVFGLWAIIAVVSGASSLAGAAFLQGAAPQLLATVNAVAAGALLTMVVNTMIPEAVDEEHKVTGVLVVIGLLVAFALWTVVDEILNSVLFLLIGFETLILRFDPRTLLVATAAVPMVLLARVVSVGVQPILFAWTRMLSLANAPFLTWAGVRGGISVALALSLPDTTAKSLILTTTYAVVLFSIIVQGSTLGLVARRTVRSGSKSNP